MATINEIKELVETANELGLDCPHKIDVFAAAEIYNGVGAMWMPERIRKALDRLSDTLLPAVLIHDIDYALGDGTLLDFQNANNRLAENGCKCADAEYPWWNPMRYIVRHQAHAYAKVCKLFGLIAYEMAIAENRSKGG